MNYTNGVRHCSTFFTSSLLCYLLPSHYSSFYWCWVCLSVTLWLFLFLPLHFFSAIIDFSSFFVSPPPFLSLWLYFGLGHDYLQITSFYHRPLFSSSALAPFSSSPLPLHFQLHYILIGGQNSPRCSRQQRSEGIAGDYQNRRCRSGCTQSKHSAHIWALSSFFAAY